MTASSVDFFPCRVKLMGLPPGSISITAANASTRPPIANIHSISRNLFGVPDPSEMKTLYQREAERVRSYVLHRYNFDTNAIKAAGDKEGKRLPTNKIHTCKTTMIPEMQPTQLPSLIDDELRQHEECLNKEKERLDPSLLGSSNIEENTFLKVAVCNKSANMTSPVVDYQKRSSRQSLLKESYKIRKNRVFKRSNGQYCNNEAIRLENSVNSHRNLEILKLSKPLIIQENKCDTQDKGNEMSVHDNCICPQNTDIKENRDETISYDEKCTTFSLQLVVSTQNVS